MTIEQLKSLAFQFVSHANYTDEYIAVYESTDFTPLITAKVLTKRKSEFETDDTRIEYHFNGRVYKTKTGLLKAINKLQNKNNNGE